MNSNDIENGKDYKIPINDFKKYSIIPSKFYSITELDENEYGIEDKKIITHIPINYCFHKNKNIDPYNNVDIENGNEELMKFLNNFTYSISFDTSKGIYAAFCIEIVTDTSELNTINTFKDDKEIYKHISRITYKIILENVDNEDKFSIIYEEHGNKKIKNMVTYSILENIRNNVICFKQYDIPCSWNIFDNNIISTYLCDDIYNSLINGLIKRYVYFKERLNISKSSYLLHFDSITDKESISFTLPETKFKKK